MTVPQTPLALTPFWQPPSADAPIDSGGRFPSLFENNHTVMLVLDPLSGAIVDANPAAATFYGRTREQLTRHTIGSLSIRSASAVRASLAIALLAPSQPLISRHRVAGGGVRDVEIHRGPFREGDRTLIYSIVLDITERRRSEEALQLQSAALNAAANSVVITDRTGTIAWVNPAFTALTGYSADEAIGRNPRDLVKSGVQDIAVYGELWRTITSGQIWRGELTNRRKDGTFYQEIQTITPVRNTAGEITHFIAIKRDLTEEKRLEAQLLQSQKMEVVGRLAGGIAHDFNNLLTVINVTAEIAADALPPADPLRGELAEIRRAGERAAALTGQLLAFSRKQVRNPTVFNLGVLIGSMQGMLQRLIGEDVELTVECEPDLRSVRADRTQIEQVVMNLAVNARDAMPRGGALAVGVRNTTVGGLPYITVSVRDTGIGMDEATRARIFEPFFTTKEDGKGTGLGLSTVYGIVRQSGGTIAVESVVGGGTTFAVCLPGVFEPVSGTRRDSARGAAGGSETILVVEDERALRSLTRRTLESCGYRVLAAANGAQALLASHRHDGPIHLMLADVVLPGMDGVEVASRLVVGRPEMKLLFTSGYASDAIANRGAFDESDRFIPKPYSRADLLEKIRERLDA